MPVRNVVVIMTDQQQARACGREGLGLDTTPALDRIASAGAWFDHAFTTAPICVPARVSMLTGCFPTATRVRSNQHAGIAVEPGGNMVDHMREHGWVTALLGKNHSHLAATDFDYAREYSHIGAVRIDDRSPEEVRADEWISALHHRSAGEPFPFPIECTQPYRIVRDAIRWIDSQDRFFAWVSFPEPHNPYYVPEPYYSLFDPDELPPPLGDSAIGRAKGIPYSYLQDLQRSAIPDIQDQMSRYRANYYGMLRLIDDQVARLIGHLERTNRLDDTLVFYVSDHGDYVGDYGLMRKGAGCPDTLMRIPFVVSGGEVSQSGRCSEYVSLVDIFPTVCEATGTEIPGGVQGRSLWPILTGERDGGAEFGSIVAEQGYGGAPAGSYDSEDVRRWLHETITFQELGDITQAGSTRVLWKDNWKLVISAAGDPELYDLSTDRAELSNLAGEAAHGERLSAMLAEYARRSVQFEPPAADPRYQKNPPIGLRRRPHNWNRV